jgi:hypothetical protein
VKPAAVPHDGVGIGADAVGNRLDERERDRGGEDRVDRAAAGASICRPACAASGCEVDTAFAASSGFRGQA